MRRIALALIVVGTTLLFAAGAQAAVLTSSGGVISYVANQGEKNDLLVSTDTILGGAVPVYSFKDLDANPIQIGGGPCQLINGVGMCLPAGINAFAIDLRDGDDTGQVSESITTAAVMIGGRGVDVLMGGSGPDVLKGNDGRDSLRGRQGTDVYKGGRGRDNLQTLDGVRDTLISCGDGGGDVVRKDAIDPRGLHCEFSNHKNPSKPH